MISRKYFYKFFPIELYFTNYLLIIIFIYIYYIFWSFVLICLFIVYTFSLLLQIDQPSLGMSRKYFMKGVKDPDIVAYHKYQTDLAVLLGAEPERAKKDMMDALLFEIAMSNVRSQSLKLT